jgi:hypothetical protein
MIAQQVKELALPMRGLQNDIHIAGLKARESVHPVNEAHARRALLRWSTVGLAARHPRRRQCVAGDSAALAVCAPFSRC